MELLSDKMQIRSLENVLCFRIQILIEDCRYICIQGNRPSAVRSDFELLKNRLDGGNLILEGASGCRRALHVWVVRLNERDSVGHLSLGNISKVGLSFCNQLYANCELVGPEDRDPVP